MRKVIAILILFPVMLQSQTKIILPTVRLRTYHGWGSTIHGCRLVVGRIGGDKISNETPPDIHPGNYWSNTTPPSHGNTYLGMVVRDNETYEGIAQRLNGTLKPGSVINLPSTWQKCQLWKQVKGKWQRDQLRHTRGFQDMGWQWHAVKKSCWENLLCQSFRLANLPIQSKAKSRIQIHSNWSLLQNRRHLCHIAVISW